MTGCVDLHDLGGKEGKKKKRNQESRDPFPPTIMLVVALRATSYVRTVDQNWTKKSGAGLRGHSYSRG